MSKIKERTRKICTKCIKEKNITDDFYLAANDLISSDGRLNICKSCLTDLIDMNTPETLIDAMRAVDRPFIKERYDEAMTKPNPLGYYMRMLGTIQHRDWTYLESDFDSDNSRYNAKTSKELNKPKQVDDIIKFKITPEIVLKWGSGYPEAELYQLETFYEDMITANDVTTPQHKEYLKLICKLSLEQNKALSEGRVNEFKNLNTQYNVMIKESGFRPIDRKSGGESAGIRTFSQVWEEIEKDGFIEPHPYEVSQEIVDRTIMYVGNYTRKLVNMQSMSEPPKDTPKVNEGEEDEL
ncbi:hypothetical protein [Sporosarcina sp. FSL W7-1283]|uniref:hypothetical protein n=1 Tax=Sporosarcina sp. FSL W7-1283 TaxID=2921560 RepID=UPI0030F7CA03